MKADSPSWKITRPCQANWDQMRGDDQKRFCEHCQKYVHNVSAMSRAERESFALPEKMGECVVYCQRPDGEIADLSFLAALRRWFPFLRLACWSTFIAMLPFITTGCPGARGFNGKIVPLPQNNVPTPQSTGQTNTVEAPHWNP